MGEDKGGPAEQVKLENFCLDVRVPLETDRVKLVPFELSKHTAPFVHYTKLHPEIPEHTPIGPWADVADYDRVMSARYLAKNDFALFAVFVKHASAAAYAASRARVEAEAAAFSTAEYKYPAAAAGHTHSACWARAGILGSVAADGEFAGTIGLLGARVDLACAEIGAVFILPRFHRTFVNTHACGLLLAECLTPASGGGLGLRRVTWEASSQNARSRAAAERLGFRFEGTKRWDRLLRPGKPGNGRDTADYPHLLGGVKGHQADYLPGPGRDSFLLSLCWDDWLLDRKKEHVEALMARK